VDAHYSLAIALDQVNRLDEAEKFYGNVLTLYPQHAEAHNYLGVIHARQGRVAQAAKHFRAAVGIRPGYRDAQRNLERASWMLDASPTGR
jgi:Flp pilus assembly protein TadD